MNAPTPGQAARAALASAVHELIDGYCPDIPMCPRCKRQEVELLDLADDYAATAAPDSQLGADNASLRKERDRLRGRLQAVRRLMEDAAATGVIDSQAVLDQLDGAQEPQAAPGPDVCECGHHWAHHAFSDDVCAVVDCPCTRPRPEPKPAPELAPVGDENSAAFKMGLVFEQARAMGEPLSACWEAAYQTAWEHWIGRPPKPAPEVAALRARIADVARGLDNMAKRAPRSRSSAIRAGTAAILRDILGDPAAGRT